MTIAYRADIMAPGHAADNCIDCFSGFTHKSDITSISEMGGSRFSSDLGLASRPTFKSNEKSDPPIQVTELQQHAFHRAASCCEAVHATCRQIARTKVCESWWGTIITKSGWNSGASPWINGDMSSPSTIWYWLREALPSPPSPPAAPPVFCHRS